MGERTIDPADLAALAGRMSGPGLRPGVAGGDLVDLDWDDDVDRVHFADWKGMYGGGE